MSSAIFRVRYITPISPNHTDSELIELIADTAPIRRGQSIFTIRDRSVINELHNQIPNIRVINVERRFPNTVRINFIERREHFYLLYDGYYFITDETLHTLRYTVSRPNLIELRLSQNISIEPALGQVIAVSAEERSIANELMLATDNLNHDAVRLFRYLDFSGYNSIVLRTQSGVRLRFVGKSNLTSMLRTALSVYENNLQPHERISGTITVFESDSNRAVWSAN